MEDKLIALVKRFLPHIKLENPIEAIGRILDFYGTIYSSITATIGLIWLFLVADLQLLFDYWDVSLFVMLTGFFFRHYAFFIIIRLRDNSNADFGGAFSAVTAASAAWLFGPTALILSILHTLITRPIYMWRYILNQHKFPGIWWNLARNFLTEISTATLFSLIPLQIYKWLGGTYPVNRLNLQSMLFPIGIGIVWAAVTLMAYLPQFLSIGFLPLVRTHLPPTARLNLILQMIFTGIVSAILIAFAVFAATLYQVSGFGVYVFFVLVFLLAAYITHHLSHSVERNRQRTVAAERLEKLSRAILDGSPDASDLGTILQQNIIGMIGNAQVDIRLFPEKILVHNDQNTQWEVDPKIWTWLQENPRAVSVERGEIPAWEQNHQPAMSPVILMPILRRENGRVIGGIWVELFGFVTADHASDHTSTIQALAHQIESALHSAKIHQETIELQKAAQELEIAGKIQASFLPTEIPTLSGWDIAATLLPARQTSGDFYDFVHLENGNLGIIVADVADKGTGAALYMALSRTLIRTYAMQYPDDPAEALRAANERILTDTQSNQFVTVFYGIVQPDSGTLVYANAGHNPAMVIGKNSDTKMLTKTGIPLGMFDELKWKQESVQLSANDILLMYTDGASEAQNSDNAEFGENRMIEVANGYIGQTALDVQDAIMEAIQAFVGDAPQFDDITLMAIVHQ